MQTKNKVILLVGILVVVNFFTLFFLFNQIINQRNEEKEYMAASNKLVGEEQEGEAIRIIADTDQGRITEAPMVAMVGHQVVISGSQKKENTTIEIIGNNGFIVYPERSDDNFIWTPQRAGIYCVNLVGEDATVLVSREINVSDIEGGNAYQLGDLTSTVDSKGNVFFNTSIFSTPQNTEGNKAEPVTAFTIGESGIWSKRIKDYSNDHTSIVEGKDFELDRGTYYVRAALRDKYSVSDEDYKNIEYTKKAVDGHTVKIDYIEHTVVDNKNGTKSDKFVVNAHCSEGCELVYAFFVDDSINQMRTTEGLNGYQESKVFTCPTVGWEYTFTARVKHKENAQVNMESNEVNVLKLPNSYEDLESISVAGTTSYQELAINKIEIEPFILGEYYNNQKSNKQVITGNQKSATVYAHNNNYITVYVDGEGDYQYTVVVNDDGESIALEEVENESSRNSKTFVYYPKSGGSKGKAANPDEIHTLTISVTELDDIGYIKSKTVKTLELEVK